MVYFTVVIVLEEAVHENTNTEYLYQLCLLLAAKIIVTDVILQMFPAENNIL